MQTRESILHAYHDAEPAISPFRHKSRGPYFVFQISEVGTEISSQNSFAASYNSPFDKSVSTYCRINAYNTLIKRLIGL